MAQKAWSPTDTADVFGEDHFKGYNFLGNDRVRIGTRVGMIAQIITYYASAILRKLSAKVWNINLGRKFSVHLYGYPRQNVFFGKLGILDKYRKLCNELDVSPASFQTAKAFYLAEVLERHRPNSGPTNILEIGSGPGLLAVMLLKGNPQIRYVMVDFPELLTAAAKTLGRYFPHLPIELAADRPAGPLTMPDRGVLLLRPEDCSRLPDDAFDLSLCIDLLPVMSAQQVEEYLALAQRVTKKGGIFLTLNGRKTSKTYDNNPLLYPHRPNEILVWETDHFHFDVLKYDVKDTFMLRIERVRK